MEAKDHNLYRLLQVDSSAEPAMIRQAFRYLGRKYHPETPGTGSRELYAKIVAAYRILGNKRRRFVYDNQPDGEAAECWRVLPSSFNGCTPTVLLQLNSNYCDRLSRIVVGPGGLYFAADSSIWFTFQDHPNEYARLKGNSTISGLCFDSVGRVYVAVQQGIIYKINPNKGGTVLANLDVDFSAGCTGVGDIVLGQGNELFVSNFSHSRGGISRVTFNDSNETKVSRFGRCAQGLALAKDGTIWCLEPDTASLVQYSYLGVEVSRFVVGSAQDFQLDHPFGGSVAMDNEGHFYVTATRAGTVLRVSAQGCVEVLLSGLLNPTGIAFQSTRKELLILESGRARVLCLPSVAPTLPV